MRMKQRMKKSTSSKNENGCLVDSDDSNKKIRGKIQNFEKKLVKFDDLPDYLKDNEFIRDHYRCEWPLRDVTFSVFSIHNETINIWTHLLGFLIFLWLMAMSLSEKATVENLLATFFRKATETESPLMTTTVTNKNNGSDAFSLDSYLWHIPKPSILYAAGDSGAIAKWPWFIFLGGAMCCLLCSSLSHLFACHSKRFNFFFWRLDYAGISVMIICSFFAPIYYAFYCHPFSCIFYLTSITLVGILAIITLLAPALSSARFRSFRATLFLTMGFSGVVPAAHAVILYYDDPRMLVSLGYEIVMGLLYAAGAVFYVSRIPERWKPGKFDIVGHSHQIFHAFVVAAALAHSAATLVIMDWRQGLPSCNAMHGSSS